MTNWRTTLVAAGTVTALGFTGIAIIGDAGNQHDQALAASTDCVVPAAASVQPAEAAVDAASRDDRVARNIKTLISEGRAMEVPGRGIIIAIAVALVESNALNLASRKIPESIRYPHDRIEPGDHMSIGIMQQQVGQGWFDTVENGMKPAVQARSFYSVLLGLNGWKVMSFSAAAQAVQRSGFPLRYGQREKEAAALYQRFQGDAPPPAAGRPAPPAAPLCETLQVAPAVAGGGGGVVISGRWANPLRPAKYAMTSPFGPRFDPVLRIPKPHKGQDLGAPTGTPVRSICDGKVINAGWDGYGGGNMVTITCGGDITVKLMHNSAFRSKVGDSVSAGDVVALVGSTGNSTGPHSHLQIEVQGAPVNPVPFMKARGVPLCEGSPPIRPSTTEGLPPC